MSHPDNLGFYPQAQAFETFHRFTSYYNQLLQATVNLVQAQPGQLILDLGAATGDSTRAIARRYPDCQVIGVDHQAERVALAKQETDPALYPQVDFITADITRIDTYLPCMGRLPEIITALYTLHRIPDPEENKLAFLEALYALPVPTLRLVIGDVTTPIAYGETEYTQSTLEQWSHIAQEGYRSVFLNRYMDLIQQGVPNEDAREAAILAGEYVKEVTQEIGEWTANRYDEFPLSLGQTSSLFLEAGFHLELFTTMNPLGDVLLVATRTLTA